MWRVVTPARMAASRGVSIRLSAPQPSHQARSAPAPRRRTTCVSVSMVTSVRFLVFAITASHMLSKKVCQPPTPRLTMRPSAADDPTARRVKTAAPGSVLRTAADDRRGGLGKSSRESSRSSQEVLKMESPGKNGVSYEFGPFRVDAGQRLLFREGRPVPLAPKVVETLVALVECGGTLVTKGELMERLWPDTFVEESNLTQNVFLLRKALGEGTGYIETVPRRGYRFAGEVRRLPAAAGDELILTSRTRAHILREEETTDDGPQGATEPHASGVVAATATRSSVVEATTHARREAPVATPAAAPSLTAAARRRARLPIALAVLTALLIAGGFGVSRLVSPGGGREASSDSRQAAPPPRGARALELRRLTYDSKAFDPAISPDGGYVAYRFHEGDQESVRLRNIANGSTVEVMPPIVEGYSNLAFSPDGSYLYFTTLRKGVKNAVIARAPVFGGTPQEVVREVWSSFALSPDGQWVYYANYAALPAAIEKVSIDGG